MREYYSRFSHGSAMDHRLSPAFAGFQRNKKKGRELALPARLTEQLAD